jgi:hypothetical protein
MEMQVQKKKEVIWNIKRKNIEGGFQLRAIQSGNGVPEVIMSMNADDNEKQQIQFNMNIDEFQNYFAIISAFYSLIQSGDIDAEMDINSLQIQSPHFQKQQQPQQSMSRQQQQQQQQQQRVQHVQKQLQRTAAQQQMQQMNAQQMNNINTSVPPKKQIANQTSMQKMPSPPKMPEPRKAGETNVSKNPMGLPIKMDIKSHDDRNMASATATAKQAATQEDQQSRMLMEKYKQVKSELQTAVAEVKAQKPKAVVPIKRDSDRVNVSMSLESPQDAREETPDIEPEDFDELLDLSNENVIEGLNKLDELLNSPPPPASEQDDVDEDDGFEPMDMDEVHTVFKKGTKLEETEWDPW